MLNRALLISMLLAALATQTGCAPLAAGVAGAAIGHEAAERDNEDD